MIGHHERLQTRSNKGRAMATQYPGASLQQLRYQAVEAIACAATKPTCPDSARGSVSLLRWPCARRQGAASLPPRQCQMDAAGGRAARRRRRSRRRSDRLMRCMCAGCTRTGVYACTRWSWYTSGSLRDHFGSPSRCCSESIRRRSAPVPLRNTSDPPALRTGPGSLRITSDRTLVAELASEL